MDQQSKLERAEARSRIFLHNDGIGLCAVMAVSCRDGILKELHSEKSLDKIAAYLKGRHEQVNKGALNILLRLLVSQGWLENSQGKFFLTPEGKIAESYAEKYAVLFDSLPKIIKMEEVLFGDSVDETFASLVSQAENDWGVCISKGKTETEEQIREHLNGVLIGPIMVVLKDRKILDDFQNYKSADKGNLNLALKLLQKQGWISAQPGKFSLTSEGVHASSMAWSYGVPVSYLPTFYQLKTILFSNPKDVFCLDENGNEKHVNRRINVKGSGSAHKNYFRKLDEAIMELFDKPFEEQPLGVADTGCGDGTFLRHIYDIIKEKTLRGRLMSSNPKKYKLMLVGIDLNKAAQEETKETLSEISKNPCAELVIIQGDVNKPEEISQKLADKGIEMKELLHVRSFLDHNRPFAGVVDEEAARKRKSASTGAFMDMGGNIIPNNVLEQNLAEHFKRWSKYLKHGLLVLELHTVNPKVSAENRGKTLAVSYDATHGFTGQLIVEENVFERLAAEAGLFSDEKHHTRYPDDAEKVTVSIHKFSIGESRK